MSGLLSFRQKILLGDCNPVVYLRGERGEGRKFFAYLSLPMEQLMRLNRDMDRGVLVHLAEYGKVILQGFGEPNDDQKRYMERHYAFDHTDPFADDEDDDVTACAA
jgi:hypothetical protein